MPKEDKKQPATTVAKPKKSIDKSAALMGAGIATVAILLIGGIAFGAAGLTRKNTSQGPGFSQSGGQGGGMGRGGFQGQRPTDGEVKSIDGSTITITDRDNITVTVTVNSDTKYTQDREDASLSDIKTGDTIVVMGKESDNKVTATRIIINPSFTSDQQ